MEYGNRINDNLEIYVHKHLLNDLYKNMAKGNHNFMNIQRTKIYCSVIYYTKFQF